jgi:DNA-directed RNA polymerase subunit omega
MYKIPEDVESKYEFVILAAKRAEQLQMGAPPRIESESSKVTIVAQEEVAAGLVTAYNPDQEPIEAEAEEE